MLKTMICIFVLSLCTSVTTFAEEYIFTTNSDFIIPRSSSIQVVNSKHRLFTTESFEDIEYLSSQGIIESYEPMSYSYLFDYTPKDKYYDQQTNLAQVYTQFSWNRSNFGKGVKIAVIDSGFYISAPDFNTSNIYKVKDYTSTASSSVTYCNDEIGHGTMVTGIIAAAHNERGIAGIAPQASIYVYKCFYLDDYGNSVAPNDSISDAIFSAIDDYGVDIINISSGTLSPTILRKAVNYAESKGVTIVAAAGNDGASSGNNVHYPAGYSSVIAVGSVTAQGRRAAHSQRNEYVNVMAPGEYIYSVTLNGYETNSGTSFAAPHVTAALALAKSLNGNLTSAQLKEMLYASADIITDKYSGNGVLNIQALLTYAKSTLSNNLIYSVSDNASYYAYTPPDGYSNYYGYYSDNILTNILKSSFIKTTDNENFKHFIWKTDTLTPYSSTVERQEY